MDTAAILEAYPSDWNPLPEAQYSIVPECLTHIEFGKYLTYGIQVNMHESTYMLHDVSICKYTVEQIVALLNRYQASPVHLHDIVMDMLP